MASSERRRRILPTGLTGLAGVACAACCLVPLLLAAGLVGGVGWALAGRIMPGIAVALGAAAGVAWWWAVRRRRHGTGCAGGSCSCGDQAKGEDQVRISVRSSS